MVKFIKILSFIAVLLYGWGVVNACRFSLQGSPELMSPVIGFIVSSMTPVFATNLGAVVGIAGLASSRVNYWNLLAVLKFNQSTVDHVVSLQIFACYFYMVVVGGAMLVWGILDFTEDPLKIVLLLPELGKSLVGVVVGAFAALLGVNVVKRNL